MPLTDANGASAGLVWKKENDAAYAHWSANQYTLDLDYCGATSSQTVKEINVTYDTEITDRIPVPSKTGSAFQGWFTAADGGNQVTDYNGNFIGDAKIFTADVYNLEDLTLYAHWGDKIIIYQFVTNVNNVKLDSVSYKSGSVIKGLGTEEDYLPTVIKDNYCFVGWYFDSSLIQPMTFPYTVPDDAETYTTLYAKFEAGSIGAGELTVATINSDTEYKASYSGNATKIVVPDTYYGKKITRIENISSTTLKEVILPQTVNMLSNNTFANCSALEKVNLPFGLTTIPNSCFAGCTKLKSLVLPTDTSMINDSAFSGCATINKIVLPVALTNLGKGVFRNMASLTEIVIDDGNDRYLTRDGVLYSKTGSALSLVQYPAAKSGETYTLETATTKILQYAFSSSKISTITINGKISTLEVGAFENCTNLINVTIDSSATTFTIGNDVFKNCTNLKALIIKNSKVPSLGTNVFDNVLSTFSVYVISNLMNNYKNATNDTQNWRNYQNIIYGLDSIIGDFAVEIQGNACTIRQYFGTATKVVIPSALQSKTVAKLDENSFSHSKLTEVTIPSTVQNISNNAFANCQNLQKVYVEPTTPPTLGTNVFANIADNFNIYVKGSSAVLEAYRSATGWSAFASQFWNA